MIVTALGSSGGYPEAGRSCSGYLIEEGPTTVLVDLGPGVLANLQRFRQLSELDAILISHLHADHCAEIDLFRVFLNFDGPGLMPMTLIAPEEAPAKISRGSQAALDEFHQLYAFSPWEPASARTIGALTVSCALSAHAEPTFAMRIEGEGGSVLAYTADTGPSSEVEALANGADTLIAESTWLDSPEEPGVGHLTAGQAGEMAHRAGVDSLMLTHFWPGTDREVAVKAAQASFDGIVVAASEGRRHAVREVD